MEVELKQGHKCAIVIGNRAQPGEIIAMNGGDIWIRCNDYQYVRHPEQLTLTVQQAAEQLGVSETTIRRHIRNGILPVKRIGRKTLIPLDKFRAWLNEPERVLSGAAQGRKIANSVSARS